MKPRFSKVLIIAGIKGVDLVLKFILSL